MTPGEAHDLVGADRLLPDMRAKASIADKAFDADERVVDPLTTAGKQVVIPPKSNRKRPRAYNKNLYKARHLIELLRQAQAVSRNSNAINGPQLSRRHPPGRYHHLAQLTTDPSLQRKIEEWQHWLDTAAGRRRRSTGPSDD